MFCSKCGKENQDDAVYCGACGTRMVVGEVNVSARDAGEGKTSVKSKKRPWFLSPSGFLWWRVANGELEEYVENYKLLKGSSSYRVIPTFLLIFRGVMLAALYLSSIAGGVSPGEPFPFIRDVAIHIGFAALVYGGYRWAMIAAMAYITIGQVYGLFTEPFGLTGVVFSALWWVVYMRFLYRASEIERLRKTIT